MMKRAAGCANGLYNSFNYTSPILDQAIARYARNHSLETYHCRFFVPAALLTPSINNL